MNPSDRDLKDLLRAACPPEEPPPRLRARVLRAARARARTRRAARLLLPFAAGIATALVATELFARDGRPRSVPGAFPALESIADRPPPPSVPDPEPTPDAAVVAYVPIPRIS